MLQENLHNGSHMSEKGNAFEWWYWHFVTEDGRAVNVVLHETDVFGLRRQPYTSLCTSSPATHRDAHISPEGIGIGQTLQISDHSIFYSEDHSTAQFSHTFPDQTSFSGCITKLAQPMTMRVDPECKGCWVVQIPHGLVSGTLIQGGVKETIHGMAYQDHQWGNLRLQDFASHWTWGHFSNAKISMIYFRMVTLTGNIIDRSAIVQNGETTLGNDLCLSHLDVFQESPHPHEEQVVGNVSMFDGNIKLAVNHDSTAVMRTWQKPDLPGFGAHYTRWGTQATVSYNNHVSTLWGVSEYMNIKK